MNAPETILITGTVTRLIYSDKGTDFRILEIQPKGAKTREVVTCEWAQARIGAEVEAYGQWRLRKKSQQMQFTAHALTEVVPTGTLGLQRWLETGVKGIGKSTAKKLVNQFGADVPDVLDHHPERLAEIGLSENQVNNILKGWKAASASRVILHFLHEVGIGPERSSAIWRHFKDDPRFHNDPHLLVAVLRGNPYLLIEVRGVGFSIADQVGGAMGMLTNDTARIQAGILHILQERAERDGHIWATYPEMESAARELLGVSDNLIHEAVNTMLTAESPLVSVLMTESSDIVDSSIALAPMHYMEKGLAREIRRLAGRKTPSIDIVFPEDCLADEAQASALQTIGASPFCILRGPLRKRKKSYVNAIGCTLARGVQEQNADTCCQSLYILQLGFATLEGSKHRRLAIIAQTFVCAGSLTRHHRRHLRQLFTCEPPQKSQSTRVYWISGGLPYDFFRFLKGPPLQAQAPLVFELYVAIINK